MARRKSVNLIREISGDPRFNSPVIQKFINVVMWRGKKNAARTIVYDALEFLSKKVGTEDVKIITAFEKIVENVTPMVEVRGRRVGGSVYQVPVEVPAQRGRSLAFRWLVSSAATRGDKTMGLRLGNEMVEALEGRGNAVKKKQDVHKMAEANRAFSHFSW